MKFYAYFGGSLLSVFATVYYAFCTRGHFYPSVLYLVSSKFPMVVCGNMAVATGILVGQIFVKLFFDQLRDNELELLYDLLKYEIMETVFAFALFRNEITTNIMLLFGGVMFLKSFHLITKSRVQYLEQVMPVSWVVHARLQLLILSLAALNIYISYMCIQYTILHGKTVLILFGFEFGLLIIGSFNVLVKYYCYLLDSYLANGLHSKGLYIMVLELVCDALRMVVYFIFFCLIFSQYGIPIHILRYSVNLNLIYDRALFCCYLSVCPGRCGYPSRCSASAWCPS